MFMEPKKDQESESKAFPDTHQDSGFGSLDQRDQLSEIGISQISSSSRISEDCKSDQQKFYERQIEELKLKNQQLRNQLQESKMAQMERSRKFQKEKKQMQRYTWNRIKQLTEKQQRQRDQVRQKSGMKIKKLTAENNQLGKLNRNNGQVLGDLANDLSNQVNEKTGEIKKLQFQLAESRGQNDLKHEKIQQIEQKLRKVEQQAGQNKLETERLNRQLNEKIEEAQLSSNMLRQKEQENYDLKLELTESRSQIQKDVGEIEENSQKIQRLQRLVKLLNDEQNGKEQQRSCKISRHEEDLIKSNQQNLVIRKQYQQLKEILEPKRHQNDQQNGKVQKLQPALQDSHASEYIIPIDEIKQEKIFTFDRQYQAISIDSLVLNQEQLQKLYGKLKKQKSESFTVLQVKTEEGKIAGEYTPLNQQMVKTYGKQRQFSTWGDLFVFLISNNEKLTLRFLSENELEFYWNYYQEKIRQMEKQLKILSKQNDELSNKLLEKQEEIAQHKEKYALLQKKEEEARKRIEQIQGQLKSLYKQNDEMSKTISEKEKQIAQHKEQLNSILKKEEEARKKIDQMEFQLKSISKKIEKLNRALEEKDKENSSLNKLYEQLEQVFKQKNDEMSKRLSEKQDQIAKHKEKLADYDKKNMLNESKVQKLNALLQNKQDQARRKIGQMEEQLNCISKQKDEMQKRIIERQERKALNKMKLQNQNMLSDSKVKELKALLQKKDEEARKKIQQMEKQLNSLSKQNDEMSKTILEKEMQIASQKERSADQNSKKTVSEIKMEKDEEKEEKNDQMEEQANSSIKNLEGSVRDSVEKMEEDDSLQDLLKQMGQQQNSIASSGESGVKLSNIISLKGVEIDSKVIGSVEQFERVIGMFEEGEKIPIGFSLLFRASDQGFDVRYKKKYCGVSHTVLLAKTDKGKVIGGYTPLKWKIAMKSKGDYQYDHSGRSFIFNLTDNHKLKLQSPKKNNAIFHHNGYGPWFSRSILIDDFSNTKNTSQSLWHNPLPYVHPEYEGNNEESRVKFCGSSDGQFLTLQWEVHQVIFEASDTISGNEEQNPQHKDRFCDQISNNKVSESKIEEPNALLFKKDEETQKKFDQMEKQVNSPIKNREEKKEENNSLQDLFKQVGQQQSPIASSGESEVKSKIQNIVQVKGVTLEIDSKVIGSVEQFQKLIGMFKGCKKIPIGFNLLFRASDYDFDVGYKQKYCGVSHTVLLAKTDKGKVIGGYTPLKWKIAIKQQGYYQYDHSGRSFIFNLTDNHKLTLNSPKENNAIFHHNCYGPWFSCSILIGDFSNTENASQSLWHDPLPYMHPEYKGKDEESQVKFCGSSDGFFLTPQWEVHQVIFKSNKIIDRNRQKLPDE